MSFVKPYNTQASKKAEVEQMFDNISGSYDLLNHLLSMQIDKGWRNTLVKMAKAQNPKNILDVATGTGDLAIALAKNTEASITAYDLSQKMIDIGQEKVNKKDLNHRIRFIKGDAENIPFEDKKFDIISVSFGVRNFENLEKGLQEMKRVLTDNGTLYILEFSKSEGFFSPIFNFYFKYILPTIGKLVSNDARAYTYLPDSVDAFPYGEKLKKILLNAGFTKVIYKKLTFGVATIYQAIK